MCFDIGNVYRSNNEKIRKNIRGREQLIFDIVRDCMEADTMSINAENPKILKSRANKNIFYGTFKYCKR
jgi:hypothetical protein